LLVFLLLQSAHKISPGSRGSLVMKQMSQWALLDVCWGQRK